MGGNPNCGWRAEGVEWGYGNRRGDEEGSMSQIGDLLEAWYLDGVSRAHEMGALVPDATRDRAGEIMAKRGAGGGAPPIDWSVLFRGAGVPGMPVPGNTVVAPPTTPTGLQPLSPAGSAWPGR
jgi:hypothetical protein